MRNSRQHPRSHALPLLLPLVFLSLLSTAQTTHPINDVADPREHCYAFTHATVVRDDNSKLADATLVIRDGLIAAVGVGVAVPKDAVVVDCSGKFIYPSFIDLYSDYGMPVSERGATRPAFDFRAPAQ